MHVKHVLVVDDSKSARFMLRKMLGKINLTADLAESGEEALTYLQANQPDAIFMDHMMPGMNGLETVEKIKENPQTAVIPVVMYTSQDGEEYKKNIISYGIADILPKPASADNLSSVVRKINDLPEATLGQINQIEDKQQASNDALQPIATDEIEKIVRKTAESAVAAAVRVQVMAATVQQLSRFKKELKAQLCDKEEAQIISEKVFDDSIKTFSDSISTQIQDALSSLSDEMSELHEQTSTAKQSGRIDAKTLNEIKSIARISSTNKAVEVAKETANIISRDSMMVVTEAINDANQKMTSRITLATIIASSIGIASAVAVFFALA